MCIRDRLRIVLALHNVSKPEDHAHCVVCLCLEFWEGGEPAACQTQAVRREAVVAVLQRPLFGPRSARRMAMGTPIIWKVAFESRKR
eukprot:4276649-Alexandrium_andersonii.AAC.1